MLRLARSDLRPRLQRMEPETFTACVTDPPYELGFMGKAWDRSGIAYDPATWVEVLRVLKPGAFLFAFGGTRTYHRVAVAIEDSGFLLRDCLLWVYGSGMPKGQNISKAIDKRKGASRKVVSRREAKVGFDPKGQGGGGWKAGEIVETEAATPEAQAWEGYNTGLKPAWEPIIVAMRPTEGSFPDNALAHGVAGLNIDGTRIDGVPPSVPQPKFKSPTGQVYGMKAGKGRSGTMSQATKGRYPANLIHDGSPEVLAGFPNVKVPGPYIQKTTKTPNVYGKHKPMAGKTTPHYGDSGSASRFFYCAKASRKEKGPGNTHPTVKPLALMRYLLTLVTYPGVNYILDPFCGSGSTLVAAQALNLSAFGIDKDPEAITIARRRLNFPNT